MRFSKKIEQCQLSPIRKFYPFQVEYAKRGKKIYHLNIGQPDIPTPPAYYEAVRNIERPVLEYAPSPGIPELIGAVQKYYAEIGVGLDANDVIITTGGSEALQMVLNCILDEDDEVLSPAPFYPNYSTFVSCAGGKIAPIPTTAEEGYRFADREKIEKLITGKTRAILITNPGNPTGVVLSSEEMRMLADVAKAHGLFLIGDEVYREFVYDNQPLSTFASFADASGNTIIIDSVSKRFSACGARVGTIITKNKELQQHILKLCQARLSVATLDQIAAAALYDTDASYFAAVRAEYKARRDTFYRKLMEIPGVVCQEPMGAFYIMAKLPVDDAEKFQTWLLTEFSDQDETVMFAPGNGFYSEPGQGVNEARFAYVINCRDLERAGELLKLGVAAYNR